MLNETTIPVEWFASYMKHVVNNINNREGHLRFSYKQLLWTLKTLEYGEEDVDEEVKKLISAIVQSLPPLELSERQVRTLYLAALNAQMAYHLVNPDLHEFATEARNEWRETNPWDESQQM